MHLTFDLPLPPLAVVYKHTYSTHTSTGMHKDTHKSRSTKLMPAWTDIINAQIKQDMHTHELFKPHLQAVSEKSRKKRKNVF